MSQANPKKLLNSKWTAVTPKNKEKHFMVVKVEVDEMQIITRCILEAVMTKSCFTINWRDLNNAGKWRSGWN